MRAAGSRKRGKLRQLVLDYVERHPGARKSQVAKDLGAGWTSVQHNVRVLVRQGVLRELQHGRQTLLVPAHMPPSRVALIMHVARPEHRRLIEALAKGKQVRIAQLVRELHWSRKTVRRSLLAMCQGGLVARSPDFHPRFTLTPAGRRAVSLVRKLAD